MTWLIARYERLEIVIDCGSRLDLRIQYPLAMFLLLLLLHANVVTCYQGAKMAPRQRSEHWLDVPGTQCFGFPSVLQQGVRSCWVRSMLRCYSFHLSLPHFHLHVPPSRWLVETQYKLVHTPLKWTSRTFPMALSLVSQTNFLDTTPFVLCYSYLYHLT